MRRRRLRAEARSVRVRFRAWKEEHHKQVRAAAVIVTIIAALVFFGEYGEIPDQDLKIVPSASQSLLERAGEEMEAAAAVEEAPAAEILVDISGEVAFPGVYVLPEGSRLADLVEAAGGLTAEADIDAINRAGVVTDGQKIYVPAVGEGAPAAVSGGSSGSAAAGGKIDINHATAEELQALPGVGPATAEKIVDYRETYGPFEVPEDLKKVSGIGEKTYQKMEDQVTVG